MSKFHQELIDYGQEHNDYGDYGDYGEEEDERVKPAASYQQKSSQDQGMGVPSASLSSMMRQGQSAMSIFEQMYKKNVQDVQQQLQAVDLEEEKKEEDDGQLIDTGAVKHAKVTKERSM